VFQADYVGAVVMPGGGEPAARQFDAWQEWAKQRGAKGLAYVTLAEDGTLGGPVAKNLSERRSPVWPPTSAPSPVTASSSPREGQVPGAARCGAARSPARARPDRRDAWSFVWVVDAPLFEPAVRGGGER
jgi:aspartyl-tRNA synthetase